MKGRWGERADGETWERGRVEDMGETGPARGGKVRRKRGDGENTEREKGSRVSGSGDMAGAGRKPAVSSASSRLRRVSLRLGIAACHPVQATHHRRKTLQLGIAIATCAPAATTEGAQQPARR